MCSGSTIPGSSTSPNGKRGMRSTAIHNPLSKKSWSVFAPPKQRITDRVTGTDVNQADATVARSFLF
jgi:hypothetical protein